MLWTHRSIDSGAAGRHLRLPAALPSRSGWGVSGRSPKAGGRALARHPGFGSSVDCVSAPVCSSWSFVSGQVVFVRLVRRSVCDCVRVWNCAGQSPQQRRNKGSTRRQQEETPALPSHTHSRTRESKATHTATPTTSSASPTLPSSSPLDPSDPRTRRHERTHTAHLLFRHRRRRKLRYAPRPPRSPSSSTRTTVTSCRHWAGASATRERRRARQVESNAAVAAVSPVARRARHPHARPALSLA